MRAAAVVPPDDPGDLLPSDPNVVGEPPSVVSLPSLVRRDDVAGPVSARNASEPCSDCETRRPVCCTFFANQPSASALPPPPPTPPTPLRAIEMRRAPSCSLTAWVTRCDASAAPTLIRSRSVSGGGPLPSPPMRGFARGFCRIPPDEPKPDAGTGCAAGAGSGCGGA